MFREACPACHAEAREGGSKAEGLNSPQDESAAADMTAPFMRWLPGERKFTAGKMFVAG